MTKCSNLIHSLTLREHPEGPRYMSDRVITEHCGVGNTLSILVHFNVGLWGQIISYEPAWHRVAFQLVTLTVICAGGKNVGKIEWTSGATTGIWGMPGELHVCHLISPHTHPVWDSNSADGDTEAPGYELASGLPAQRHKLGFRPSQSGSKGYALNHLLHAVYLPVIPTYPLQFLTSSCHNQGTNPGTLLSK